MLLPEEQLRAYAVRQQASGTAMASEINTLIAPILVARFSGRSLPDICAIGGLTIDDFTSSAIDKEIFGQGRSEGLREGQEAARREGRREEAAALALRQLQRRCGALPPAQQAQIQTLPLAQLEALAEALLDFQGPARVASKFSPAAPPQGFGTASTHVSPC